MSTTEYLQVIWSPDDYQETLESAQTHCPAALSMYGLRFECDNTQPHTTHTCAALRVRWAGEL